jgi:hypothetical protein
MPDDRAMTTDRWRRIDALYHDMLARSLRERAAALAAACPGDVMLQAEVQPISDRNSSGAIAPGSSCRPSVDRLIKSVSSSRRMGGHVAVTVLDPARNSLGYVPRGSERRGSRGCSVSRPGE